jgi:peptide/nickel transport system ATP-binding protein
MANEKIILEVNNLKKYFPIRGGFFRKIVGNVKAVDDVSFKVYEGETLGLVGESGCGKTTTGRCILRAIDPTEGEILFSSDSGDTTDVATLTEKEMRRVRREMQMIFQDPYASLNPRMNILNIVGEPLLENLGVKGHELEERVRSLLDRVGLNSRYLKRYPHAFSGGQRQRIGIARALALNPRLIVADEPVSALDVSIQAQILNLLQDLQEEFGLTYLFVAHDLSVVEHISDRVAVMYVGKIVELTETEKLFSTPKHPYTESLLAAVPKANPRLRAKRTIARGEVADPSNPPPGCIFHPRCPYTKDICKTEPPELKETGDEHLSRCHFAEELKLTGVVSATAAT